MFIFSLVISLFYIFLIISLLLGWKNIETFPNNFVREVNISVVVAYRNEAKNLPNLLDSLNRQVFGRNNFEVIFVNDHSIDSGFDVIKKYDNNFVLKNINLVGQYGKKNALACGIKAATGEIIVTTDADCIFGSLWLLSMNNFYVSSGADMIVAPVMYINSEQILSFTNFQALEFMSLQVSGAGAIGLGMPIMSNGANLCFRRDLYLSLCNPTNSEYFSGDDTFLMFSILETNKKAVKYLKNKDAIVYTSAAINVRDFVNQRLRWTSKTVHYSNFFAILTAIIIFISNFNLFVMFWLSVFCPKYVILFIFPFVVKMVFDFPILFSFGKEFNNTKPLWSYLPVQVLYFFYISGIVIMSFFKKFSWKDRKSKY